MGAKILCTNHSEQNLHCYLLHLSEFCLLHCPPSFVLSLDENCGVVTATKMDFVDPDTASGYDCNDDFAICSFVSVNSMNACSSHTHHHT